MEKMTKKEKFKKFVKEHEDLIAAATYFATAVGLVVAAAVLVNKIVTDPDEDESTAADDLRALVEWTNEVAAEKDAEDKNTFVLYNSEVIAIPKDTPIDWIQK